MLLQNLQYFLSYKKLALDFVSYIYQVIPGNDQNMSPTNQKTAESKLERTS